MAQNAARAVEGVSTPDRHGYTPLYHAMENSDIETFKIIVSVMSQGNGIDGGAARGGPAGGRVAKPFIPLHYAAVNR